MFRERHPWHALHAAPGADDDSVQLPNPHGDLSQRLRMPERRSGAVPVVWRVPRAVRVEDPKWREGAQARGSVSQRQRCGVGCNVGSRKSVRACDGLRSVGI